MALSYRGPRLLGAISPLQGSSARSGVAAPAKFAAHRKRQRQRCEDGGTEISEAVDFVRTNSRAVLSTTRRDGTPRLSPVTVATDDAGRVLISSRQTAAKTKNLIRDPRAWLAVFGNQFYGPWVQISGPAEIISLPDAMPLLMDYYRSLSGEHPDWDEYRTAMERDQRCLIRITPSAAGPTFSG